MSVSISFFFVAVVPSVVNTVSPDGQGKSDNPPTRGNERFNVKLMVFSSGKIELIFFLRYTFNHFELNSGQSI